jgi:hypothetical protein
MMARYKYLHRTELMTEPPLAAETYQTPDRQTGRRILVKTAAGELLFDTDDHYDIGNACDAVDRWATNQIRRGKLALPVEARK